MNIFYIFIVIVFVGACSSKHAIAKEPDVDADRKYMWLESIEGETALDFVKELNQSTIKRFENKPLYKSQTQDIRNIIFDESRIEPLYVQDGWLYSLWKDKANPRGIWRRTKPESYASGKPQWEILLDLDALAKKEKENWVWQEAKPLRSDLNRVLISLSRGGKDASVIREYDLSKKQFVTQNGFNLPEAKGDVEWIDKDTLLVGTDFGPNTMTTSGYPKQIRKWKRGTDYKKSEVLLDIMPTDMAVYFSVYHEDDKKHIILKRQIGFFEAESTYLKEDGTKIPLPISKNVKVVGFFKGNLLLENEKDFLKYKKGSLLALPVKALIEKGKNSVKDIKIVFAPTKTKFLTYSANTKNHLVLLLTDNIVSKVEKISLTPEGKWVSEKLLPELKGSVYLSSADEFSDYVLLTYTDFFVPSTLYGGNLEAKDFKVLKSTPAKFKTEDLEFKQYFAKSADGTKIPYYLVSKKDLKKNGQNPTVMYGYGGFAVTRTPFYSALTGKLWLEKGGVYVLANLRGGGEFGPQWHQQVLKENRYKVYEDFVAIAEDLIKKKITSPKHLGIWGGSNGGLLVGATMVKRPDLFNAALCQVPLLDMLRYHKLLAGASWMDEYGNPDDPKMRQAILKYSPLQNVKKGVKYPEIFFMTSTKDDRVHPGHARKMAAKMQDQGHSILYYENIEGGHKGNANQEQEVLWQNLMWTYLWEKLGNETSSEK